MYADPDDLIPAAQQLPLHKEGEHVIVPVQDTGQVSWAYVGVYSTSIVASNVVYAGSTYTVCS